MGTWTNERSSGALWSANAPQWGQKSSSLRLEGLIHGPGLSDVTAKRGDSSETKGNS